jgi:hypothetical protein
MVGMRPLPHSSPTQNKLCDERSFGNKTPPLSEPALSPPIPPVPELLSLGLPAARSLLRCHALPKSTAQALESYLLNPLTAHNPFSGESLEPDTSPIRWKARVCLPHGASPVRTVDVLCDNGAHGEFMSCHEAEALGLKLVPLPEGSSARLPNGAILPMTHRTEPVTVEIDRQYKGDISFRLLPLKGMGMILGFPWLHRHKAIIHHSDKTVRFHHRGRDVVLLPRNPVYPAPALEPLQTPPPWISKAPLSTPPSSYNSHRPSRTTPDPRRCTHLLGHKEASALLSHLKASIAATQEQYAEATAEVQDQGSKPPVSQRSLSSFNMYWHVEVNSAQRFEKHVESLTSDESLDTGVLYVRGTNAKDMEISDRPFFSTPLTAADVLVNNIADEEVAIWSLSSSTNSTTSPIPTLPSKPILSIPDYLDTILPTLNSYSTSLRAEFESLLLPFAHDVFPNPPCLKLGPKRPEDLVINEEPGSQPVWKKVYRLSPPQVAELRAQLEKMLEAGIIQPSSSPYGAPVLLAPKKDGGLRLCVDYRALNNQTVKDKFPIPLAEDLFDRLGTSKVFSKIDLFSGFWQLRIDEDSVHKTAFRTPFGQYEWLSMPMGLCNSPSVFQRLVTRLFGHLDFVEVFIDDILIHSVDAATHLKHVAIVLKILQVNSLTAKLTKCDFFAPSVEFLGHVVSADGISMEPSKTKAINDWPEPCDIHELRSFLGLANYYRRFVENYAELCLPLFSLFKKGTPFEWTDAHTLSFSSLKTALTSAPVLEPYNPEAQHVLVTDASKSACGAALMQDSGNGLHPVAFYSRKFIAAECNYTTREQELLAICAALKTWRHYLAGMPIEVHTDHESLKYIQTQPTESLSPRLARWQEHLSQFNFTKILHVKGKDNVVADALSRRPDLVSSLDVFCTPLSSWNPTELNDICVPVSDTLLELVEAQKTDPFCQKMITLLQKAATNPRDIIHSRFALTPAGTLVWTAKKVERIVVPPSFRSLLLAEAHDCPVAGHRGIDKTYAVLTEAYYWPAMYRDVHDYCVSCDSCQSNKPRSHAALGPASPVQVPELPWVSVGIDFVGPMPMTKAGHNNLVTFTDYLTRSIRVFPIRSDDVSSFAAKDLAEIFFNQIFRYHGLPAAIHTDRGSTFTSEFWTELMTLCGSKLKTSTAYHPQTQGLTERANRTILYSLKHYLHSLYEDWDLHLVPVEFAYNTSVHAALGATPFEALYGFNPRSPVTLDVSSHLSTSKSAQFLEVLRARVDAAREHLLQTQISQSIALNKHCRPHNFKVGDQVWLSTANLDLPYPKKFKPSYLGPFPIINMCPHSNAADLLLPPSLSRHHSTFNTSLLKPYFHRDPSLGPSAHAHPPPVFSNQTGTYYLIERIVAEKRHADGEPIYTIKWVGWPHKDNTTARHNFLFGEPGGQIAIDAWRARQAAIPAAASADRAARHRYKGRNGNNIPAPIPAIPDLPPTAVPPAPVNSPPAHAPAPSLSTRSGRSSVRVQRHRARA